MCHCAWQPCGKCVFVKLSLSVNCENFGESFFFFWIFVFFFAHFYFLCWSRLWVARGFVDILSARVAGTVWHFCWFQGKGVMRLASGMVQTHLWPVGVDEWLFRSVFFFIYVGGNKVWLSTSSAHLQTISLTWKWFWSFYSLFCHLSSKSLRPHIKDGLLLYFLLSLAVLVGFKK